MIAFAIRNDGLGWRAVNSESDVLDGESYSAEMPPLIEMSSVPQEVTRYQALAALHLAGILVRVEAMMADQATDMLTVLAWRNAQEFRRTSPMVLNMAQALGLSDQQLDDLFIAASAIE